MRTTRKIAALTAAAALTGSPLLAGRHTPVSEHRVIVCAPVLPDLPFMRASSMSAEIFARIGVTLEWRALSHCPAEALRITVVQQAGPEFSSAALAYSLPREGTNIVVFMDRVQATVPGPKVPVLLAHVLAHEITHVLQGVARHSGSGLMKARWELTEYCEMEWRSLPFTPEDVELIYQGLARRESRVFVDAAVK